MSGKGAVLLLSALPLTAACVAACVGCGNPGPAALRGSPQAVVRAAADRTIGVGSAHVAVTIGADMAGTGVVDLAHDAASVNFARTGTLAYLDDRFSVISSGPLEWVSTAAGSPWVTGSPQAVTAAVHTRVDPLDTVLVRPGLGTDVSFLRGAIKVTSYGGEEVRGTSTYRYTFLVDLPTAIALSPVVSRPALEAASLAIGPVQWPADVWLDSSGRVRRLQMAEDPFAHTTTTKANLLITQDGNYLALTNIEFYDFGTPAAVTPPPADQAVEAT